jgi:hypothetical protein
MEKYRKTFMGFPEGYIHTTTGHMPEMFGSEVLIKHPPSSKNPAYPTRPKGVK